MAAAGPSIAATAYPRSVAYCPMCGLPPEYCEYGPTFERCKPWLRDNFPLLYPALFSTPSAPPVLAAAAGSGGAAASGAVDSSVAAAAAGIAGVSVSSGDKKGKPVYCSDDSEDASDSDSSSGDDDKKKPKGKATGKPAAAGAGAAVPAKAAAKAGAKGGKPATAITITKKERGRGKCVTIIRGLETFDVKLKEAASALGKKFGTGGTVTKDASGVQEVTIQGEFTDELPELLHTLYGIPEKAVIVKE